MKSVLFVRQPIFDAEQRVYAYELVYHVAREHDEDRLITMEGLQELLRHFSAGRSSSENVFINVSWPFLHNELRNATCPDLFSLEVQGGLSQDNNEAGLLRQWKQKGFIIALDDFAEVDTSLLAVVDVVKIDIMTYDGDLEELVRMLRKYDVKLLAVEVETYGQFELCKRLGFDFFQGYFFHQPSLLVDNEAIEGNKGRLLQLMNQVMKAELPTDLERDISHDLSLSYKLLCYINSASIGLRRKVDSIAHALTLLGLDNIRTFITRLLMMELSDQKPEELLACAFVRGRFLELLAIGSKEEQHANDYFVLGMFSLLDVMLDMPLERALAPASLPVLVKDGLFRENSVPAMRLELIRALEKADWSTISALAEASTLKGVEIASLYRKAAEWADEQISFLNSL